MIGLQNVAEKPFCVFKKVLGVTSLVGPKTYSKQHFLKTTNPFMFLFECGVEGLILKKSRWNDPKSLEMQHLRGRFNISDIYRKLFLFNSSTLQ